MNRKRADGTASIVDIAKKANVSMATVSRVLNQFPNVAESTRQSVMDAVNELGYNYERNRNKSVKTKNQLIMVVVPAIGYELYNDMLKGIYHCADKYNYKPVIVHTFKNASRERELYKVAIDNNMSGVILVSSQCAAGDIQRLVSHMPVVQCFDYVENTGTSVVRIDDEKAGYDATKYLISKGNRKIALITSLEKNSSALNREKGYKKALKEAGLAYDPGMVFYSAYDFETNEKYVRDALEHRNDMDAVFCVGDLIAYRVLQLGDEMGIRIPEDLSVMGFDDLEKQNMFKPALTTVFQDVYKVGFYAVKALIDQIELETNLCGGVISTVEYKIVERETVADRGQ